MAETKRFTQVLNIGEVDIRGKIAIGGAGAVSSFTGGGISAVAHPSTGAYTLTLDRGYVKLWGCGGVVHRASGATLGVRLAADYTSGSPTVALKVVDSSGTLTDPSSGDFITFELNMDDLGVLT